MQAAADHLDFRDREFFSKITSLPTALQSLYTTVRTLPGPLSVLSAPRRPCEQRSRVAHSLTGSPLAPARVNDTLWNMGR